MLSVVPGGTSAGYLEEGKYLDAALWAIADAGLTISIVGKLGQVGAISAFLVRSQSLANLSKSSAKFGRMHSAKLAYGAMVAYGILGVKSGLEAIAEFANCKVLAGSIKAFDALLAILGAKSSAADYIKASQNARLTQQRLLNVSVNSAKPALWWFRGAENDASWRALSLKDKFFYEIGQKTMASSKFSKYADLNPVSRGRKIVEEIGWLFALLPEERGWLLGLGSTFRTGPTALVRWFLLRIGIAGGGAGGAYILWNWLRQPDK